MTQQSPSTLPGGKPDTVVAPLLLTSSCITKRFPGHTAISEVSLSVSGGEHIAVVGQNGAGKSTLLRIFAGLLQADSGNVCRHGTLGYHGHESCLYEHLTVQENLSLFASLYGCSSSISSALTQWQLGDIKDSLVGVLSQGQQTRTSLARATLHRPALLLLDEPTSALDATGVNLLQRYLASRSSSTGTVIVTHDLARIGPCCNRKICLERGRVISDQMENKLSSDPQ